MAEPAERICQYASAGSVYNQLSDAAKSKLCRQSIYYRDGVLSEIVHIGDEKDFSPVIEKALELGGYKEDQHFTGINGGHEVTTGFGHGTILSVADKVVEAVKAGDIRHFFPWVYCDGARPGRNYFTDFVKQTPKNSIVLTLACVGTVLTIWIWEPLAVCLALWIWDNVMMLMARSRWQWRWLMPLAVVSMICRCPWYCPGMSRKRSASC